MSKKLERKKQEKICQANANRKKAEVMTFVTDRIKFKTESENKTKRDIL